MVPFIPVTAKRILDIGCSTGGFGAKVKQKYHRIEFWGIEPHEEAAKEADKVLDKVISNPFENNMPELEGERFDVIVFNDVLEHLVEPGAVLKVCKNYLTPEGVILASIPNVLYFPVFFNQIILREDWKYTDEGILDNTHLRFFTKKSIIRLFEESGFSVTNVCGINRYVPFYYWLFNLITFNKIKEWRYRQYAVVAKR